MKGIFHAYRSKNAKLTCCKVVDEKLSLQFAKKRCKCRLRLSWRVVSEKIHILGPLTTWYSLENSLLCHLKLFIWETRHYLKILTLEFSRVLVSPHGLQRASRPSWVIYLLDIKWKMTRHWTVSEPTCPKWQL